MKNLISYIFVLLLMLPFISCQENKSPIEGLWVVKSVQIGEKEMTPHGRWMRFNADSTQESGNGWYQHSVGTYNFDGQSNLLSVINNNGIRDEFDPFQVAFENGGMQWQRKEEDKVVKIFLERSEKLPTTSADELLGLWTLREVVSNDRYFRTSDTTNGQSYLFFKWDKRFVIGLERSRLSGLYAVDGHEPVVQFIPYDKHLERGYWRIERNLDSLTLTLENADSLVMRKFVRTHEFPRK